MWGTCRGEEEAVAKVGTFYVEFWRRGGGGLELAGFRDF